jgi:hypothetical protein
MTADTGRVSFGIKTSQDGTTYDQILRIWREAEAVPEFERAWLWDHLVPLRGEVTGLALEAWTLLAGLAAQTSRLRLGVIVTSNRIRPPAVLAKMAATVDIIAGRWLVFGIGAGGSELPDARGRAEGGRRHHRLPGERRRRTGQRCGRARLRCLSLFPPVVRLERTTMSPNSVPNRRSFLARSAAIAAVPAVAALAGGGASPHRRRPTPCPTTRRYRRPR